MEDRDLKKKRWSVTYTKHLRQKRKTYQDGFLDLHLIANKVMLLDDCEKLLECRILNHDEAVRPGETLSLNSFLVDVGDPVGDHHQQSVTDPKVFESPRAGFTRRKKFRTPSIYSGNGNNCVEKDNAPISNLSPSRKVIREFKKSELQRYGASKSYRDMEKSSVIEWQVMYTTHVTQKAKKYHDGFLKLATCGSHGRQVMLHDESRKLLTSRFLKKDEIVRSNESLSFDGYLVEIGELLEQHKPLVELNIQQANCSTTGKTRTVHEQHGYFKSNTSVGKEFEKTQLDNWRVQDSSGDIVESDTSAWQVMYTTQMMQKSKKYHDGFLRLAKSGSLGRQIMLYDASKKLIASQFLKKAERISSGDSIVFDAHLVDIGEPEGKVQLQAGFSIKQNITSDTDSYSTATGDGSRLSKIVPKNKPLRDANQILSILQKRETPLSTVAQRINKSMPAPLSSGKAFQVLDVDADCTEQNIIPKEPSSNHGTSENMDTQASGKILDADRSADPDSSNGFSTRTTLNGNQSSNDAEAGNDQVKEDIDEPAVQGHNEALAFITSSSASAVPAYGLHDDDDKKSFEHRENGREADELPTFDLGF